MKGELSHPVSVAFLCGAEKILRRLYGKRLCGKAFIKFLSLLGQAEVIYMNAPKDGADSPSAGARKAGNQEEDRT